MTIDTSYGTFSFICHSTLTRRQQSDLFVNTFHLLFKYDMEAFIPR